MNKNTLKLKERPRCRKYIDGLGVNGLEDIMSGKIIASNGMRIQAKKMIHERTNIKSRSNKVNKGANN